MMEVTSVIHVLLQKTKLYPKLFPRADECFPNELFWFCFCSGRILVKDFSRFEQFYRYTLCSKLLFGRREATTGNRSTFAG